MSSFQKLMESKKHKTVLVGPIQRHLLAQHEFGSDRAHDVIHPSELVKSDFCPRAVYYRLSGWEVPRNSHAFQLEVIFSQGHGYHDKWQNWAWDIGVLGGRFRCLSCGKGDWSHPGETSVWFATAPQVCPDCGSPRRFLQYGEVPLYIPKYRIGGKADGELVMEGREENPLLEIKSIGEGTVRFAAPHLVAKHTKTVLIDGEEKSWTDWMKIWRDIKRPFKTHLKQAAIYCLAKGRSEMIFIYEFKPTGAVKEFRVKPDVSLIEDELEACLDLIYALEQGKVPACPHEDCKQCSEFEALRDGASDEEATEPRDREDTGPGAGESEDREGEAPTPRAAPRRARAGTGGRTRRPLGRRPDGRTRDSHSLGELLEHPGGSRGDHRVQRREHSQQHQEHRARKVVVRRKRDGVQGES